MLPHARVNWRQLRTTALRRLGFSQAAGRDVDFEQAVLRVTLAAAVLCYAFYVVLFDGGLTRGMLLAVIATSLVLAAGLWMTWWFKRHSARPTAMRYFGICADLIPMTIGLWGAGESGVPVIGIYLWVTVGNGFRFGTRYLLFSYWLSAICFTALLVMVPFWQQHRAIGVGLGLVLATIPLYVLVLLSRLTAQKDAALELSNAKSRFVANVSHELRTPLTGVFAVYDLLRRRRLAAEERDLVGSLGNAISTLKGAVDAVLQMSKLEAGAERADMRLFNLRYFLAQINVLIKPQAVAKSLSWTLDVEPDVPSTVIGDPAHLQHILGNLLNNAFKFTAKGSVGLRVKRIPGSGVRFEVTDTGIGIPIEQQDSLFERFVQADASATRKFGGTGLGTSIAHDLVLLMGGTIGVQSTPGHGATFWVELPLGEPGAALPSESQTVIGGSADPKVLLLGHASDERDELITSIAACGVKPVVHDLASPPPSFAANEYLAGLLLLPPEEARAYSESVLLDRAGAVCPWVVITRTCTSMQAAALFKTGASAVLSPTLRIDDWHREFAALASRINLHANDNVAAPPLLSRKSLRIVLADDNRSNQMLLARILQDAGHVVSMVARGDEAYDLMSGGNVDLALLDLNMPEMSGPDATKLFRAGETGSGHRLPIVILSADATASARDESLAAGANDYITKPVTADMLLATIERITSATATTALSRQGSRSALANPPASDIAAPVPIQPSKTPLATVARNAEKLTPMLVDADRIDSLRRISGGDRQFLTQYVNAAFDDLESAVVELRNAVETGNARAARDALHKIDGTGASIGAVALLASAKSMRNYLSQTLDSDAQDALAELATTCTLTKSAVTAVLHARPAVSRPR